MAYDHPLQPDEYPHEWRYVIGVRLFQMSHDHIDVASAMTVTLSPGRD